MNLPNDYICLCDPGYNDTDCDNDIDECSPIVVVSMAVHVLMGWTALAALALTDMKMIPVVSVSVHSPLKESVNRVGLCVIVLTYH